MHTEISACRVCGNPRLRSLLHLGTLALTGVFPASPHARITRGPLEVVQCDTGSRPDACGLVQLRQSCEPTEMYGTNYGYRSSLNRSMLRHLAGIVERLRRIVILRPGDIVLDIGSNDGSLLSFYEPGGATLVGVDPTAEKFRRFYRQDIHVIPEFFSAEIFRSRFGGRRAKIVTSIAMFYDLEHPLAFMEQVRDVLADDGVWCFEQSYLPLMLERNSYDTICHEHLEYYALKQVMWMADRVGLRILEVSTNEVNGGSFSVTAARSSSAPWHAPDDVDRLLEAEARIDLDAPTLYENFQRRVEGERTNLLSLLDRMRASGGKVLGYGASTKGNVVLQYCGIGPDRIPYIAEINEDKIGRYTPGTGIPIIAEAEARAMRPDGLLVLPWHFRDGIVRREAAFLNSGGKLIFPLPRVEMVSA